MCSSAFGYKIFEIDYSSSSIKGPPLAAVFSCWGGFPPFGGGTPLAPFIFFAAAAASS
jgi:hypothetical protein